MKTYKIFLLIILSAFVLSDIAYFETDNNYIGIKSDGGYNDDYNTYGSYYFISLSSNGLITLENNENEVKNYMYKYTTTDNNFYVLSGSFKTNNTDTETANIIFFSEYFNDTKYLKHIGLYMYSNGSMSIKQSGGLKICNKTFTDIVPVNDWVNYEIWVKNGSSSTISGTLYSGTGIKYSLWVNSNETKPEFYEYDCIITGVNTPKFGTFGISGKNSETIFTPITVTGYDIINSNDSTTGYTLNLNNIIINLILIVLYIGIFSIGLIKNSETLIISSCLMGIGIGLLNISDWSFFISFPLIAINTIFIYGVWK